MKIYLSLFILVLFTNCLLIFDKAPNEAKIIQNASKNISKEKTISCKIKVVYKLKYDYTDKNNGEEAFTRDGKYYNSIINATKQLEGFRLLSDPSTESPDYTCIVNVDQNSITTSGMVFRAIISSLTILIFPGKKTMHDFVSVTIFDKSGKNIFNGNRDIKYNIYSSIFIGLYFWYGYEKQTEEFYSVLLKDILQEFHEKIL